MRKKNIILAEDDADHQYLIKNALIENRDFVDVRVVSTGTEFKKAIKEHKFDCAILDYNLPDNKADSLLRAIAANSRCCPGLVISSSNAQKIAISSFRNGSFDFIPKKEALKADVLWRHVEAAIQKMRKNELKRRKSNRRQRDSVRLAERDQLTGLYNRHYLDKQLKNQSFQRDRRQQISCIMIDVDQFKQINDTYGHAFGDTVLRGIAEVIRTNLRTGDAALRWGGEEFLVLRARSILNETWNWSEELRNCIKQRNFQAAGDVVNATISMGIASFPTRDMGYEMIELADQAMYLAKKSGRNSICTWPMVVVDRALIMIEKNRPPDLERCRRNFITACKDILSPTQKQHITTHCQDVENVSLQLGKAVGLSHQQLERVRCAGLLHDVGKCIIPEELLNQRGPLTETQLAMVRRHSDFGADLSLRLGADQQTAEYVRLHHAPFCGTLTAPLGAKLVGVADALAAMRMERSYSRALSVKEALSELRRESGSQFDPRIVALAHSVKLANLSKTG
ncbi:diguanylate cyclase [Planctomycetota bacterium]